MKKVVQKLSISVILSLMGKLVVHVRYNKRRCPLDQASSATEPIICQCSFPSSPVPCRIFQTCRGLSRMEGTVLFLSINKIMIYVMRKTSIHQSLCDPTNHQIARYIPVDQQPGLDTPSFYSVNPRSSLPAGT